MDQKDLISVIVPVYNKEKYIEKCVDSIVNQTYTNLEILLIDDGSSDRSADICDSLAKKDSRIRSFRKANSGPGETRNYGISLCSGKYISFVDSDDWIETDMYERMVSAMHEHDAPLAVCGRNMVFEDDGAIQQGFCFDSVQCFETHEAVKRFLIYQGLDASPCDKLFDKSLLEISPYPKFPHEYISEDIPFVFGLISQATKTVHVGKACYNYLQRRGSYSRASLNEKSWGLKVYPELVREYVKASYEALIPEANWYYAINMMTLFMKADKKENREDYKSIRAELLTYEKELVGKYSSFNQKMLYWLIKFNLFNLVRTIRRKCK